MLSEPRKKNQLSSTNYNLQFCYICAVYSIHLHFFSNCCILVGVSVDLELNCAQSENTYWTGYQSLHHTRSHTYSHLTGILVYAVHQPACFFLMWLKTRAHGKNMWNFAQIITGALNSRPWNSEAQTPPQTTSVVLRSKPETSDKFHFHCCSLKLALLSLLTDYQVHWELIQENKWAVCKWASELGLRIISFHFKWHAVDLSIWGLRASQWLSGCLIASSES